jgi:hypothetical protein
MIFRALTVDQDWTFGRGKQNFLRDNDAIMKNIETTLRTIYGECHFDPSIGVQWFSVLGQKNSDVLLLSIKQSIYNCYGVVRVLDVQSVMQSDRQLQMTYVVDTIFTTMVTGGITV